VGGYRKVKSKGKEGRKRVVKKATGDECVFIPDEVPGWQMRSDSTPMSYAAGGEAATGPLNRKG
jgi:hypothetical protein